MKNPDVINRKDLSNLCKFTLDHGGDISQIKIPFSETKGDGLTNSSILWHNDKWMLNLRRVGYLLYHSENLQNFPAPWGPLTYLNPEDDVVLRTTNYICELNEDYEVSDWGKVNTDLLDKKPLWTFIGLEDARLQNWDNVLTQSGVRRDTTTNGEGRMELSTISKVGNTNYEELERVRVSPPDPRTHADGGSYCEKNWMPINDMPYHYVKWANPTEIVKIDPIEGTSEQIKLVEQPHIKTKRDMRGSSNVIKYKDHWIAIIHEVDLWFTPEDRKDSIYYHRIVMWDKDWNIKHISPEFDFMTARIEFTCGMAFDGEKFLIPFGFQDNTQFILQMPPDVMEYIIGFSDNKPQPIKKYTYSKRKELYDFINNPFDSKNAFNLAETYYQENQYASALGLYLRACEYTKDKDEQYNAYFMVSSCVAAKGGRDICERRMWHRLIDADPTRPEGYLKLSNFYSWRGDYHEAYFVCSLALRSVSRGPLDIVKFQKAEGAQYDFELLKDLWGGSYGKIKEKLAVLHEYQTRSHRQPNRFEIGLDNWLQKESKKYKLID